MRATLEPLASICHDARMGKRCGTKKGPYTSIKPLNLKTNHPLSVEPREMCMGLFDRLTDRLTERVGDFLDEVATPDELRLQQERALKLIEQRHYDSAITLLRSLETARPDLARTHHLLGVALFKQGDPTRAARALRLCLQNLPATGGAPTASSLRAILYA